MRRKKHLPTVRRGGVDGPLRIVGGEMDGPEIEVGSAVPALALHEAGDGHAVQVEVLVAAVVRSGIIDRPAEELAVEVGDPVRVRGHEVHPAGGTDGGCFTLGHGKLLRAGRRIEHLDRAGAGNSSVSSAAVVSGAMNVAQKLIASHLVEGRMTPGQEIGIRIDQTLTQDATGTMVMLELEAMDLDRVRTELSAQYVDHNLLQADFRNADDHLFLRSACQRFGLWYSKPGNGVSHPVHMQRFGIPGKTLLGSDSHTCAAGSLGMLAIGAGGLEVAMAMAGEPFHLVMPQIWNVRLVGELPDWVSAKDVILEMLRRHDVTGGLGRIIEYSGPGLAHLSAMDRHVIANMGAELGATATVFPSDDEVQRFLTSEGRGQDWVEVSADPDATYDLEEEIDLSTLEPLIALPSSPGNVVTVREVAGAEISQCVIGSSANPGLRDFAIAAMIVDGRQTHDRVSFDVNPTSRQTLETLDAEGYLLQLIAAGARIHQAGCMGCIGMGQAPATDQISLRTVPRNFPGRSGTREDQVYLCSPETAAASALTGVITDPRDLDMAVPALRPAGAGPRQHRDAAPPTA